MADEKFSAVFTGAVRAVVDDAKAAGIPLTKVCKRAGVGRATVHRSLRKAPKSVTVVDDLQASLAALKAEG